MIECRLVYIEYDGDHPKMDPSAPPETQLPNGFRWYWFPRRRWWHKIAAWIGGYRWIQGWQPGWTNPITIQPGETLELLVPME